MNTLKASFYTLGCRLNQAETALISNRFRAVGYDVVPFNERADVCVINSCTVTEQADAKCRQLVRQVLKRNPDTYVAVVGCYSQTNPEALQKIEGIDLVVGTNDKLKVVDFIDEPLKTMETRVIRTAMSKAPFVIEDTKQYLTTTRANLKIQDGCDFMCSFCVIPFARGRARSRAFWDIQREAIELIAAGYRELVLTGVNIGTYQFEDKGFLDIVEMLLTIEGLERLRISSIEPTTIPLELLDLMADSHKLCPHLHIPLQSGSDKVLEAMKRHYTAAEYLEFVELAAQKVPDILIATDIIVGFPGEDEREFAETCRVFEQSPLVYAHVFPFSERGGTAAQRLDGKVPATEKKRRSRELQQLSQQKKRQFYENFLGRPLRILTEQRDTDGNWTGLADNYVKVTIVNGASIEENQLVQVVPMEIARDTLLAKEQKG